MALEVNSVNSSSPKTFQYEDMSAQNAHDLEKLTFRLKPFFYAALLQTFSFVYVFQIAIILCVATAIKASGYAGQGYDYSAPTVRTPSRLSLRLWIQVCFEKVVVRPRFVLLANLT